MWHINPDYDHRRVSRYAMAGWSVDTQLVFDYLLRTDPFFNGAPPAESPKTDEGVLDSTCHIKNAELSAVL